MMSLFKKARDGIASGFGMAYNYAESSVLGQLSRRHPDIDEIFNIIDSIKAEQVSYEFPITHFSIVNNSLLGLVY